MYYSSERPQDQGENERFVVPHICMQGLITNYSKSRLPRILSSRTKMLLVVDKALRIQTKLTECVFFC